VAQQRVTCAETQSQQLGAQVTDFLAKIRAA